MDVIFNMLLFYMGGLNRLRRSNFIDLKSSDSHAAVSKKQVKE